MGTTATTTPVTQESFDAAYLKAQPAAVQKLMQTANHLERQELAQQLVAAGYVIDATIMVWAWSAYTTTKSRLAYGYTWVPSAGQPPIQVAPGVIWNGEQYDAAVAPPKSILVTLDEALLPLIFKAPVGVAE
jgi:hypothetical protein